jgi:hypothetical protein
MGGIEMNVVQIAVFGGAAIGIAAIIWVALNHQEAVRRIRKRFMRKMGFYVVVIAVIVATAIAQEDNDTITVVDDKPIFLNFESIPSDAPPLDQLFQQMFWMNSTMNWLNADVPFPANVTG